MRCVGSMYIFFEMFNLMLHKVTTGALNTDVELSSRITIQPLIYHPSFSEQEVQI